MRHVTVLCTEATSYIVFATLKSGEVKAQFLVTEGEPLSLYILEGFRNVERSEFSRVRGH